jgi:hydroxypyruvate isomerase
MDLSLCIEWMFADAQPAMGDRVRATRALGYDHGEFHLWRDKDIAGTAAALAETGVTLTGICVDPRRSMVDPAQHDELVEAVRESLVAARQLGSPPMIVASGFTREGVPHREHVDAAVAVLKRMAALAEDAGVMLVLEPLNDRVEHPGMFLVSTTLGLDLVEAVGSPNVRLLYDVYHSAVMGEDIAEVLAGRIDLVHHVQVADMPGRNEPGTGRIDWDHVMTTLRDLGYRGALGLEYRPTLTPEDSLAQTRRALGLA